MLISDWTFMQAGIVVMRLTERVAPGAEREELARRIADTADPLPFAFECLRWLRKDDKTPEPERLLPPECEEEIGRRIVGRIRLKAQEAPLYKTFGADTPGLLWLWSRHGEEGEVGRYITERLEGGVDEVDAFLGTFVGRAWGVETGLSHKADLRRDAYDAITKLVDPEIIVAKLKAKVGAELDTPEYYLGDEIPYERRLAHQFAYVYAQARQAADSPQAAGPVDGEES